MRRSGSSRCEKNLGKKNCELSDEDIQRICETFLKFEESEQSKIFPNAAFGSWKVTVDRPLRLKGIDPEPAYSPKEIKALKETAERSEDAAPVIRKIYKKGTAADPLRGLFSMTIAGKPAVVEYEPDAAPMVDQWTASNPCCASRPTQLGDRFMSTSSFTAAAAELRLPQPARRRRTDGRPPVSVGSRAASTAFSLSCRGPPRTSKVQKIPYTGSFAVPGGRPIHHRPWSPVVSMELPQEERQPARKAVRDH